jgi:carboxypeptidase C (cathepsin A)
MKNLDQSYWSLISMEKCSCITHYKKSPEPIKLEWFGATLKFIYDDGEPPSWYSTRYYTCIKCGQYWKEEFVEAMHYNANHMYPLDDKEVEKLLQILKVKKD